MKLGSFFEYQKKKKQEEEATKSLKLHTVGALSGMAIALEENKSTRDIVRYGAMGLLATLFFEIACPKTSKRVKELL